MSEICSQAFWQRGRRHGPDQRTSTSTGRSYCCKATTGAVSGCVTRKVSNNFRSAGLALGERPYDLYTLETADDLARAARHAQASSGLGGSHPGTR